MKDGALGPLAVAAALLLGLGTVHALTAPTARTLDRLEIPVVTAEVDPGAPERLASIRYGARFTLRAPGSIDIEVRGALPADLDLALVADQGAVVQLREHVARATTLTVDGVAPGSWSLRGLAQGPRPGTLTLDARLASRSPWLLPLGLLLALPGLALAAFRARRKDASGR
ncbi:MAG: hypothetical protein AAF447_27110 [Myxococcota bacterium]